MNRTLLCVTLLAALITGCSTTVPTKPQVEVAPKEPTFNLPTALTAVPTNGNILVQWQNPATADGGVWVEYTTPGSEDYIQLEAIASDDHVTSFMHLNVAPQTTLLYRLQPYFGQATPPLGVTTGVASTNEESTLMTGPIDRTNTVAADPQYSLRTTATFAKAMPSDLTVTLSSPTSVDVRWKDHASDEDGFLVEVSADPKKEFVACALMPPNMTSFRKTGLPSQIKCYFRVRAFFNGKPTDPISVATP